VSGVVPAPGDQVTVTVLVKVPQARAFQVFTEEIDAWWRTGFKFRVSGRRPGVLCLEPKVGGRLFETMQSRGRERVVETGRVTTWEPPARLVFEWRAINFAPSEKTEVEVRFEPSPSGTQVTVVHRGWAALRPDHPVRHGQEVAAFVRTTGLWWGDLLTSLREHAG
jgi:uncharacterized protein YndB with AHSA1/START domain